MKSYKSPTANGGKTVILDTVQDAIDRSTKWLTEMIANCKEHGDEKHKIRYGTRDGGYKTKVKTLATFAKEWEVEIPKLKECAEAITHGDESIKEEIARTLELLRDAAVEIEPMLAVGYRGYERSEAGFTADPGLVAAGEENPCFQRKRGSDQITKRAGDGAYRIVINTDVSWFGQPDDNCAVMGALITLLQQFGPVEVWIQQGWMNDKTVSDDNGVTLFKLDFTGSFEATQLYFWLGHRFKDGVFSMCVSRALGRKSHATSKTAEIECDLYLRGDWLTLAGLTAEKLAVMLHTERIDAMARWISETAMKIVHPEITIDV